jgi:hypothetical protein
VPLKGGSGGRNRRDAFFHFLHLAGDQFNRTGVDGTHEIAVRFVPIPQRA